MDVGPKTCIVKVADFGLATDSNLINVCPPRDKNMYISRGSSYVGNVRWGAPEIQLGNCLLLFEDFKAADIYCVGNILMFILTGVRPYHSVSTFTLNDRGTLNQNSSLAMPKSLHGPLKSILHDCLRENPRERPHAFKIMKDYFSIGQNPYILQSHSRKDMQFFSCGFMDKTDILIADCCIERESHNEGFYDTNVRIIGYKQDTLKCDIDVKRAPYRDRPGDWQWEGEYTTFLGEFIEMANQRVIDNNPTAALQELVFDKAHNKVEKIKLKQSDYIHHRAMRKIWLEYSNQQKLDEIPRKAFVHPYFSNTFALHIAVLTNEGPNKCQQFIFSRRAQHPGMPAPGKLTCGAVESASKPDYRVNEDGYLYVDLINTAARGFQEELGLKLDGEDLKAICLTTVYLKFDTHEWGLCGFVDLKDKRIKPKHRISANSLKDMFSTGPKDKFEHQTLTFIDFDLKLMVEFIFNNHEHFASSSKLVVVKVLEAFFGKDKVKHEFEMY